LSENTFIFVFVFNGIDELNDERNIEPSGEKELREAKELLMLIKDNYQC
jgi:hypothetical protein